VEERFDDNIFSTQDAPESDFVTAIMPAIAASRQATRVESEARYRLRFERFAQHPEFNQTSPDHDLDARLVLLWGRDAEIEASEHLSYTPEQRNFSENRVGNVLVKASGPDAARRFGTWRRSNCASRWAGESHWAAGINTVFRVTTMWR
jgi:hypothetical protein